ncbi:MAG: PDZ domain-containing protein [Agromyces sp.]
MTEFDSDYAAGEHRRLVRRRWWGGGAIAIAVVSASIFTMTPSPYVIEQPGPVFDTLSTAESNGTEVPLIVIEGEPSYETTGALDMLTVSVRGNPDSPLSWAEAGFAWFSSTQTLVPMEAIFPPGQSTEQRKDQDQALMVSSQQDAIAAALTNLGYDVPRSITVQGFADASPASGVLEEGDVIVQANGVQVNSVAALRSAINDLAGASVPLKVTRSGRTLDLAVTPMQESDGTWVLGIGAKVEYRFPFTVTIQLDNVGGPSAGMMFALGIIAKLTPGGDLTGGKHWAGTGTIDADGNVGPIGGIRQKLAGARAAGAQYMLAPKDNCDEVVGHIPNGLDVFAVSTLADAKAIVTAVASGADTSQFARCTSS